MMGRKSVAEIRAELEEALGHRLAAAAPPTGIENAPGRATVWGSLRAFLGKGSSEVAPLPQAPNQALRPTGGPPKRPRAKSRRRGRAPGG
jgi:hypothetical protein